MMNLLRANVTTTGGWWEASLIDLAVLADGASEEAMLRDLEHSLTAEYHWAVSRGETPFKRILKSVPVQVADDWQNDHKKFRTLNIPDFVRQALSAVLGYEKTRPFNLDTEACAA